MVSRDRFTALSNARPTGTCCESSPSCAVNPGVTNSAVVNSNTAMSDRIRFSIRTKTTEQNHFDSPNLRGAARSGSAKIKTNHIIKHNRIGRNLNENIARVLEVAFYQSIIPARRVSAREPRFPETDPPSSFIKPNRRILLHPVGIISWPSAGPTYFRRAGRRRRRARRSSARGACAPG
jgi:hypothetical protein